MVKLGKFKFSQERFLKNGKIRQEGGEKLLLFQQFSPNCMDDFIFDRHPKPDTQNPKSAQSLSDGSEFPKRDSMSIRCSIWRKK